MSDRINHITVILESDFRDDDAEAILTAIRMIKRVLTAKPNIARPTEYMAEYRARLALEKRLWDALKPASEK